MPNPTAPVYPKHFGLFRNPAVRAELQRLDPERDYERMVQLLVGYEFPFDITRALELALFHTYASPRISGLLARTGEFDRRGQKRYDDTSLLIAWFMQEGLTSDLGRRAIAQMNRIHGAYRIANDDYLLVLATFVFYPIDWMRKYGWRKLTPNEERALFRFWMDVGHRMHLQNLPGTAEALRAFTDDYEARYFRYADTNRRIADATVRIVENWFPAPLRSAVQPVFAALISPKLREAFGYKTPPPWLSALLRSALWVRKQPLRYVTFEPYPRLIYNTLYRTYRKELPAIEAIGPDALTRAVKP